MKKKEGKNICDRYQECDGKGCLGYHITCVLNQMRGMIWIITGEDPGILDDTEQVCKLLKIPYEKRETGVKRKAESKL